jgi:hypothetical protein
MVALFLGIIAAPSSALAQVPPHIPGTLCMTPIGWCMLPGQFPLNAQCWCGTMQGPVFGVVI